MKIWICALNRKAIAFAILLFVATWMVPRAAFCDTPAAITKLNKQRLQAGSNATTIGVYGSGFGKKQDIWVNCTDHRRLPTQTPGDGKTFYVDVLVSKEELETPGTVVFTTKQCPDKNKPPKGALSLAVVAIPPFKESAARAEALVGVDVNAASSVSPGASFLGLGVFDVPIASNFSLLKPKEPVVWVSGQLGLKGMAQPGPISGAASTGYYATAANATPDKIVQSIDASLHLGLQLHAWPDDDAVGSFDVGTPKNGLTQPGLITTLSLLLGGGAVTPLSFSQASPQVFYATPLILENKTPVAPLPAFAPSCYANPTQTPTCFVIFVPSDRTHFYRYYDAGFRLKLYGNDYTDGELRFPAILDVTLGQNEYVTGGNFNGLVLHLGGSLPIPRIDSFYAFGSIDMGLSGSNGGGAQLQLIPAPVTAGLTAASPSVYTISTSQPNRDRYQLGFGVDALHLYAMLHEKATKTKQANNSNN